MSEVSEEVKSAVVEEEISLLDLLHTVAQNIRLLILGPLLVGLVSLGISFTITPIYTAKTTFLPPQQANSAAASMLASLGGLGQIAAGSVGIKNPNDQVVAFLGSRRLIDELIRRFDLKGRYEAQTITDARRALESMTRISAGKDGLLTVEVDDWDPTFAASLANGYVVELRSLLDTFAVTEAQQRRVFFEKKLNEARDALVEAEQALQNAGVATSVLKSQPAAAITVVAQLQAEVTAQEVKLASMRGYLTEDAPEYKQAITQLRALRDQLRRLEASSAPSSSDSQGYVARFREFKYRETLFELYARQFEAARVDESREGAELQVVDIADVPDYKSKPRKALIAILATLASGFVLLLFVFVREALRNASHDPESAHKMQAIRQALIGRHPKSHPD